MLTIPHDVLQALLLARGDDPRPFTKALWVTAQHVLVTDGHRMHLWFHGQEWTHGNTAIPLQLVAPTNHSESVCDKNVWNGTPFLPMLGAVLPAVERYLPQLPTLPSIGVQHCAINAQYLADAQSAIKLVTAQVDATPTLHMTSANAWVWCDGKFLTCVAPLRPTPTQLKGFEK